DNCAVAGALDDAPVVHGEDRIDQVAAKGAEPSENSIFIRASKPGVADDVSHQDRGQFAGLAHSSGIPPLRRPSINLFASTGLRSGVRAIWLAGEYRGLIFSSSPHPAAASSCRPRWPRAEARKARDRSVFGVSAMRSLKSAAAVS